MKILVFTSLYPNNIWPNNGVFTKERMTPLSSKDACSFRVVAPVPYFPPIKIGHRWQFSQVIPREIIGGVEVDHPRYFMTPKVGMAFYGLGMFLSVLPRMKKIHTKFDFDIIDAHYVYPDGLAAVLLGRYFSKPVVVTSHGTDINLYPQFPLIRQLLRYTLRKADRVITVCQALKDVMIQLEIPQEKIAVITNGVDLSKFYPSPKEEARSKLGIPNKRVILSVGGLTTRKGFDLLIKALKILIESFREKNVYLVIVGEGPFREKLEKLVSSLGLSEYVRLAGARPHQELNLWFNAADLFCLASSREGWPCVLLESLACGTPVVATNIWGIPELICSDRIGLLSEQSERDIAEKISLALKRPWDTDEIVQYARGHTWDRAALSVFEVFNSVLDGRSPTHASCNAPGNAGIRKSQAG